MGKEILILSPIGRIKWLSAPDTLSEVLFHLSKTFKINEMCISLTNTSTSVPVTPESYLPLLLSDTELIWQYSFDESLQKILDAVPFEISSERYFEPKTEPKPEPKPEPKQEPKISEPLIDLSPQESWKKPSQAEPVRSATRSDSSSRNTDSAPNVKVALRHRAPEPEPVKTTTRSVRGKGNTRPPEDPKMTEALKTLKDFGFSDVNKNRAALTKTNFDIEQAIEELLK